MRALMTLLLLAAFATALPAAAPELWLYYQTNLLPEENIEALEKTWQRAAAAGYGRVLLADFKFGHLDHLGENTQRYYRHIARVREIASRDGLEIVPALFNIGYSNSMLAIDPNLAEGLPVRDALFVVRNGEARIVADPPVELRPRPDWHDDAFTIRDGIASTRGHRGNARLVWNLKVAPYRCYHVSVKVRTASYGGELEIKPIVRGTRVLAFTRTGVKQTQDWTEHHLVFGSLDTDEVSIYMGVWGDATGEMQLRDWKIEEAGPVNLIRRAGAPMVIRGYEQGRDYEPVVDTKLGVVPYRGDYSVWHEPPAIRTSLPDGTQLRVSWYFATVIHNDQVCACPSDPRTRQLLAEEARQVAAAWEPRALMMSHDEVRVLNWDKSCLDRGMTPGQILADNIAYCARLLPDRELYVWNDMFDPHHNAKEPFYLVNGDLAGSWEGLEKRITIVNWHHGNRDRSLRFFASRGHRQVIAAYYDSPLDRLREWITSARRVEGVTGIMYTTWEKDYSQLERFAEIVRSEYGE